MHVGEGCWPGLPRGVPVSLPVFRPWLLFGLSRPRWALSSAPSRGLAAPPDVTSQLGDSGMPMPTARKSTCLHLGLDFPTSSDGKGTRGEIDDSRGRRGPAPFSPSSQGGQVSFPNTEHGSGRRRGAWRIKMSPLRAGPAPRHTSPLQLHPSTHTAGPSDRQHHSMTRPMTLSWGAWGPWGAPGAMPRSRRTFQPSIRAPFDLLPSRYRSSRQDEGGHVLRGTGCLNRRILQRPAAPYRRAPAAGSGRMRKPPQTPHRSMPAALFT